MSTRWAAGPGVLQEACTHRAAEDAVLVRVPGHIPHTGLVLRQPGHNAAGQHVIDWTHTHTQLETQRERNSRMEKSETQKQRDKDRHTHTHMHVT